jgi:hypothetical protein
MKITSLNEEQILVTRMLNQLLERVFGEFYLYQRLDIEEREPDDKEKSAFPESIKKFTLTVHINAHEYQRFTTIDCLISREKNHKWEPVAMNHHNCKNLSFETTPFKWRRNVYNDPSQGHFLIPFYEFFQDGMM